MAKRESKEEKSMARDHGRERGASAQTLLDDPDFLCTIVERAVQAILEAEMSAHLGAGWYKRGDERRGYRNGTKPRTLITRVGTHHLAVPQDREGTFSTELFARYQRSEQALVSGRRYLDMTAERPLATAEPTARAAELPVIQPRRRSADDETTTTTAPRFNAHGGMYRPFWS
jgi:Transposase, Mutator family